MEEVLDVYKRPYNPKFPVVCMDETPRQLIKETRTPLPSKRGRLERHDYEYERCGVYTVFLASEPLAGKRLVKATERKTRFDWADFIKELAEHYKKTKKIILVMDNLSTHKAGSLYETFPPEEAKKLRERFEFVYTPAHGSWLNMAEIELNVMIHQCLNGRFDSLDKAATAIAAWQRRRDNLKAKVCWQFTTQDARIKLRRLYPTLET